MASPEDATLDAVRTSRGYIIIHMTIVVAIVVTLAVFFRSLARWKSKAGFGIDDYFIFGSLLPLYAMLACGLVRKGGLGSDGVLSVREWDTFLKALMASYVTYSLTITCSKVSILLLYRRIFSTRRFRQATTIVGSLCVGWCIAAIVADIFQCRPIHAAFDPEKLFTDRCMNLQAYYRGVTASNLVLDLVVLSMPLCMVWKLTLDTKQKISLSGIFLLGGLVCVASLMRLLTTGDLKARDFACKMGVAANLRRKRMTNAVADKAVNLYMWSQIEPATALVCACIPTYRPLFVWLNTSVLSGLSFSRSRVGSSGRKSSNKTPVSGSGKDSKSSSAESDVTELIERQPDKESQDAAVTVVRMDSNV
ncbi:MAG: hypothetical protein Q9182_001332 [Xanthomendoza sp. 2 TL-2023]